MSEEQEIDWGVGAQALYAMVRATKDCAKRCGALQLNRDINEIESKCLQKCSVFHAGSSSTHLKFLINYAETVHLQ
ncbi:unnamed protein product [Paramecium primaurelia]|uniref:Uncharacterized protein n=1 Tax=Paramecium primaurelia TaxID=5886 RepID=A0A8S1L0L9_PARPR|nr:unnamed protein product [Paramecium primaurelia]